MVEIRWRRVAVPGVLIGAITLAAASTAAAGVRAWTPSPCPDGPPSFAGPDRAPGGAALDVLRGAAWFRLDPVLDTGGALIGQRLTLGRNGARADRAITLARESFAAGPFGDVVLVGRDDGSTSRLLAIDVARGCSTSIAGDRAVIRRATVSPDGQAVIEARVDRATRADLGVWRRTLVDGDVRRILPPIAPDVRFGATWSTELSWSADGQRLVVESCAAAACRTRIADADGTHVRLVDDPALGPLIGVSGDRLVSALACRGLPCPIVAVDVASRLRVMLEVAGGAALLVGTGDATHVALESFATDDGAAHLATLALDGTGRRDLGALPTGQRLVTRLDPAGGATTVPAGWLLVAPGGRLPDDAGRSSVILRSADDARSVALDEVSR